jgi:hypothetical protein
LIGAQGLWVIYADMTSNFLWLECALIEFGAEIYFLRRATTTTMITSATKRKGLTSEEYTAIS